MVVDGMWGMQHESLLATPDRKILRSDSRRGPRLSSSRRRSGCLRRRRLGSQGPPKKNKQATQTHPVPARIVRL